MKKNVPPSASGGAQKMDEFLEAQKMSNTTKNQVVVDDKKIKIRYNYMDSVSFHKFFIIMEKSLFIWSLTKSKFVDDKYTIKEYKYFFDSDNFSLYIKAMKMWHTYHKVVLLFREHHRNFENIKSQLLKQYGKFDKQTNQFVLMEPENVKNFQIDYKKLKNTIVQIDINKLSPQLLMLDIEEIVKETSHQMQSSHFFNLKFIDDNPWIILCFYEMLSDIFDLNEIDTWNYKKEIDGDWDKNFAINL